MEVKKWTYEEFPEYTEIPEGAQRIETTGNETGVRFIREVEYAAPDGVPLHLNILLPVTRNEPDKKYPCLVYVQGSAWKEQDLYMSVCCLDEIVKKGFAAAIVQYRHTGQAPFPAQIRDARNAIRYMRAHAAEYRVNPDEIFIGGDSSGGHTAVFCALAEEGGDMDESLFPGVSAEVRGVLDYYGTVTLLMEDGFPTTTSHHTPKAPEGKLLGGIYVMEHPELAAKASAVTHITPDKKLPPFCIFHGTKDRTANARQSVGLYEKLRACGKEARLYLIAGADHCGPEFWAEQAVNAAAGFMRKCLEKPQEK